MRIAFISISKSIFLGILSIIFLGINLGRAQDTSNEEVKRLQRAIFINNFAQQVIWKNSEDNSTFKIGVLGPDRTVIDLQSLAQRRKIFNKPVEVQRFQLVKEIADVDLLYVNNKYNYDIDYILNKITGKNILLITEDYKYNSSMINMINVDDTFEYEINNELLNNGGFLIAPSLSQYAISSAEKWRELFLSSERSLNLAEEENERQKALLVEKQKQLKSQKNKIDTLSVAVESKLEEITTKNEWLDELWLENELQKKKFEDKVFIERELEKNIREQVVFIQAQQLKIDSSTIRIKDQERFLEEQNSEIAEKEIILKDQISEIKAQKKVNLLLAALFALALLTSLILYRGYLVKKKLNQNLEDKNEAIVAQSLELGMKNRELEQFAYIASHDLKEPLNSISSLIDLLKEDYSDTFDREGNESIEFIKSSSERMKKLVDGLLAYSRLGKARTYDRVDCNLLMSDLKKDLQHTISKTKAEISIKELPVIKASDVEMRMIFQNLVSNALKFVKKGVIPQIEISCEKSVNSQNSRKGFWQFEIRDNGIGIAPSYHERIFSIFQRLHSREEYEGTGIGLAHCKKIVESHGGEIWLKSEENKGSSFYFSIPFRD